MKSRSPPMREACLILIFNFMFTSRSDTIENPSKFTEDKFAKDFQIDILETLVRAVYVSNWIRHGSLLIVVLYTGQYCCCPETGSTEIYHSRRSKETRAWFSSFQRTARQRRSSFRWSPTPNSQEVLGTEVPWFHSFQKRS